MFNSRIHRSDENFNHALIEMADFIIDHDYTIRNVASVFNCSKSAVHNYMRYDLKRIDKDRYDKVRDIFNMHFNDKHITGGDTTKQRYAAIPCTYIVKYTDKNGFFHVEKLDNATESKCVEYLVNKGIFKGDIVKLPRKIQKHHYLVTYDIGNPDSYISRICKGHDEHEAFTEAKKYIPHIETILSESDIQHTKLEISNIRKATRRDITPTLKDSFDTIILYNEYGTIDELSCCVILRKKEQ